jgi:predicted Zn-dependent protease with MMP-like domain
VAGQRVRHDGQVLDIGPEEFEELVAAALDEIPDELARLVDNVVFVVEDDVPPGEEPLLGLYEGVPLTERGSWYAGVLPDRITIYRRPTLEICDTVDDVVDEVHVTVVHEIAHHFGIDDDRLHELGYD